MANSTVKPVPHIAVLGGGPCGLYAARTLSRHGFKVTLLDKGERPGGLAAGHRYGANWYDSGVHMLHAFDKEIFEDIKHIMGDERIEVELNAKIKWAGRTFRYPLQFIDILKCIPFFKLTHQVINLFLSQFKNYLFPKKPTNAEEALVQLYGKPLYKYFFEEFTHRYWDIHPKKLSATFVTTKMPKLTAVDVVKKALEKLGIKERNRTTDNALTSETLHYSRTGAEAMPRLLAKEIEKAGGRVLQNVTVKKIVTQDNLVKKIGYEYQGELRYIDCDACVSAITLPSLMHAFEPNCPSHIIDAAKQLRYKPIVVYGLLVKKDRCLDSLYVYYRDRIFHRIGEPKNAGLIVEPADHTVLIVEMTCEIDDAKWRGDDVIKQTMIKQLSEEGICQGDDIVEINLIHNESGYPIFNLGFEPYLDAIVEHINQFPNLQSTGRQGAFTYPNMHTAMRMGKKAAEQIIKGFL